MSRRRGRVCGRIGSVATSGVTFERVAGGDGRGARTDAEGPVEEGEGDDGGVVPPGDGLRVHLDHLTRWFSSTLVNRDPAVGGTRIRERRTLRTNPTRRRGGRRRFARARGLERPRSSVRRVARRSRACDGVRYCTARGGVARPGVAPVVTVAATAFSRRTAAAISNFGDRIDRWFRSNGFRSTRVSSEFFIGDSRVFGIGASRGAPARRVESSRRSEASARAERARSRR